MQWCTVNPLLWLLSIYKMCFLMHWRLSHSHCFNVGSEYTVNRRKEDLNHNVTISHHDLRYLKTLVMLSGDVVETPHADVGLCCPCEKHACASFSRTNRNAGVNVSIYRWRQPQQHSSQGSIALTALLFYSGILYIFKWVAMPWG